MTDCQRVPCDEKPTYHFWLLQGCDLSIAQTRCGNSTLVNDLTRKRSLGTNEACILQVHKQEVSRSIQNQQISGCGRPRI